MEDNKRESIYKVGDILEFDANVKGLVACIYPRAAHSEFLYGIWTWDGEVADCDEWLESDLITQAKRVDHMDISSLVGDEEEKKKWEVTGNDLPRMWPKYNPNLAKTVAEVGIDVKCDDSKDRLHEDAKELLEDLKNCIDPNYQCCDCPYNEDCDTGRENLMEEAIRVLSLLLEKKPVYEYDVEGKPIGKVTNKEICDDGLKVTISKVTNSTEDMKEENKKLKKEIETMKEALDRQKHDNDIWKQGWFECLKSVGYYLNS